MILTDTFLLYEANCMITLQLTKLCRYHSPVARGIRARCKPKVHRISPATTSNTTTTTTTYYYNYYYYCYHYHY